MKNSKALHEFNLSDTQVETKVHRLYVKNEEETVRMFVPYFSGYKAPSVNFHI